MYYSALGSTTELYDKDVVNNSPYDISSPGLHDGIGEVYDYNADDSITEYYSPTPHDETKFDFTDTVSSTTPYPFKDEISFKETPKPVIERPHKSKRPKPTYKPHKTTSTSVPVYKPKHRKPRPYPIKLDPPKLHSSKGSKFSVLDLLHEVVPLPKHKKHHRHRPHDQLRKRPHKQRHRPKQVHPSNEPVETYSTKITVDEPMYYEDIQFHTPSPYAEHDIYATDDDIEYKDSYDDDSSYYKDESSYKESSKEVDSYYKDSFEDDRSFSKDSKFSKKDNSYYKEPLKENEYYYKESSTTSTSYDDDDTYYKKGSNNDEVYFKRPEKEYEEKDEVYYRKPDKEYTRDEIYYQKPDKIKEETVYYKSPDYSNYYKPGEFSRNVNQYTPTTTEIIPELKDVIKTVDWNVKDFTQWKENLVEEDYPYYYSNPDLPPTLVDRGPAKSASYQGGTSAGSSYSRESLQTPSNINFKGQIVIFC